MTETDFRELLAEALFEAADEKVRSAESFETCGVLTMNEGLVVRLSDGTEFQVTVVRSR